MLQKLKKTRRYRRKSQQFSLLNPLLQQCITLNLVKIQITDNWQIDMLQICVDLMFVGVNRSENTSNFFCFLIMDK